MLPLKNFINTIVKYFEDSVTLKQRLLVSLGLKICKNLQSVKYCMFLNKQNYTKLRHFQFITQPRTV